MDTIKGELAFFNTGDGLVLHGFLARPRRLSRNAIIHVHGLNGSFYRNKYAMALLKRSVESGFNFLSIEQRGSYGAFGLSRKTGGKFKRMQAGGAYERFEDSVNDIGGAIRFLGRLGINRIFLEGHSTGCQKIAYYQYKKRDRRVKGIVLSAPVDDYSLRKHELGKEFSNAVSFAKRNYKGNPLMPKRYMKEMYSSRRFLSFSDLKSVEARMFHYNPKRLKEFSRIKVPVLAIFGSKEQYATMQVKECMDILKMNSGSKRFDHLIINGANHGFIGKEDELARAITKWVRDVAGS
ncbi:MAG: alpha/beta hydrolase [Candidatus Micrarchaeaceae archaeon]